MLKIFAANPSFTQLSGTDDPDTAARTPRGGRQLRIASVLLFKPKTDCGHPIGRNVSGGAETPVGAGEGIPFNRANKIAGA